MRLTDEEKKKRMKLHAADLAARPNYDFHGSTFDPWEDGPRLHRLQATIRFLMLDGEWWTKDRLREAGGLHPEAEIGPRIRDLRKHSHGNYIVPCVRRKGGIWVYRIEGHNTAGKPAVTVCPTCGSKRRKKP